MTKRTKAALKKEWPGEPIIQALFITSAGSEVELETCLPPELFKEITTKVLEHMGSDGAAPTGKVEW